MNGPYGYLVEEPRRKQHILWALLPTVLLVGAIIVIITSVGNNLSAQGTFHTQNIVVDNHQQIGGAFESTDLGSVAGTVCGQNASSNWMGPACWNYHAVAGDNIHDIIDAEWNTSGANASTSGEQIPFVAHVNGNVDTTAAPSQAIGFQASVAVVKSAGANPLSCAAFQGGAGGTGCDTLYSFKGDGGQLYNRDSLFIGDSLNEGSQIDGNILIDGNAVTLGNVAGGSLVRSISSAQFDREVAVDPTGGVSPLKAGGIGAGTMPTGSDKASIEIFAQNGKNAFLIQNSSLAGIKGWSYYNVTNGANSDLKFYNYSLGRDSISYAGATDNVTFAAAAATATTFMVGSVPTANHGTLDASANNYRGRVSTIGANTAVTLTFGSSGFAYVAHCTTQPEGAGILTTGIDVNPSATAPVFSCFTLATGVAANCPDFTYRCD